MSFKEIAPFVIIVTIVISILISMKVKKKEILTIDGIFSIIGFLLGLVITFLNLIYSNNYMITLGPNLAIASILYLRFRNKILINGINFDFNFNNRIMKMINIFYWVSIIIALISYQQSFPYYRSLIFFVDISFSIMILGLEIISARFKDNFGTIWMIFKILLISLILRASAYFISPYPIGVDPWGHAGFINDILHVGNINVFSTSVSEYYVNYPLMHIYAVSTNLIGNIGIKGSMFIIGAVIAISTVFVYLIVKIITGNINLALLSMLILNFADFHIQWSIEVIAMSFGIAIYTILLYLIMERNEKHLVLNNSFLVIFLFIIIWTHTISGFIALISVISLYIGSLIYKLIYKTIGYERTLISFTFCTVFILLLLYHWMAPNYPFLDSIIIGLINSLSLEAKFLGRATTSNVVEGWNNIFNIAGFLIYIFFGIIGCLYCLSKTYITKKKISLIFMLIVLYFIFFVFPLLGLRNILPYRWPAFIYVSFMLFTGIGLIVFSNIFKSRYQRTALILSVLFLSSIFMITNFVTDMDSPFYGKDINQKRIWTESEMKMFENVNKSYNGVIVGDLQTSGGPFQTYLKRKENISDYQIINEDIDWTYMDNKMIVWREISLTRPIQVRRSNRDLDTIFDKKIEIHFDGSFSKIYDVGDAKAYLSTS